MIYLLLLLLALTGAAEEAPVPLEGVMLEPCTGLTCDTPTPSELPGPRP